MARNPKVNLVILLGLAFLTSLFAAGATPAQVRHPEFVGEFKLVYQVYWGNADLQPGAYKIIIKSLGSPIIASIQDSDGNAVTNVVCAGLSSNSNKSNALLIKEKNGKLTVHSLAIADRGILLVYDSSLARERVQEAREIRTVPVIWGRK
jgi:hypothetical protein